MDKLDTLLLEAWNRISGKVRADRVGGAALKRSRRRFKGILTRPMREWCLVIRASDTRISDYNAIVEPVSVVDPVMAAGPAGDGDGDAARRAAPRDETETETKSEIDETEAASQQYGFRLNPHYANFSHNPIESQQPHTVTLDGRLIRELTKPMMIPWPGVTYREAADLLGREYKTMRTWARELAKRGMFRVDYYREFGFPEDTTRSRPIEGRGETGHGGRPYVWTPTPIDPNAWTGRTPHAIFGTLWQWLWENLPEDYVLRVRREPRVHTRRGKTVFRGWEYICPGRIAADGTLTGCGRRCTHLFAPQTVWTLGRALDFGSGEGFDMPEDGGAAGDLRLAGQWFPGLGDTVAQPGKRSFACRKCWRVRNTCFADASGWNEFIAHISGGLLYGHDVPRPLDMCPMIRKTRPRARRRPSSADDAAASVATNAVAAQTSAAGA